MRQQQLLQLQGMEGWGMEATAQLLVPTLQGRSSGSSDTQGERQQQQQQQQSRLVTGC